MGTIMSNSADKTQETRKPSLMDMLLCRCASTEPQGSMGKDGKFHLNLRSSNSNKFDQLEDSVHRLCNNKKKSTSQQKYVPRPAHPLLQKKDAENGEGNAANGTSAETPPQAQGYVPRAAHPMLSKKNTGDEEKKEASPEQDSPSNLEPTEKNDAETVEKDEVGNSQPEPEIEKGQEKTDASTKE